MLNNVNFEFVTVVGNGSVYQNKKDGKLGFAFYYDLGGIRQPRKVITGKTEEELETKALKFLKEQNNNYIMAKEVAKVALEEMSKEVVKPVVKTFSEVGAEWYTEYGNRRFAKKKSIEHSTYAGTGYSLKRINKHIGNVNVSDITNEMAENLIDSCSVKDDGSFYSKAAVDRDQQVFLSVMEYARKHGYCNQIIDKVELMDGLTVPDKDARFLDKDRLDEVFKACQDNKRYSTLLKLLIATGLRQEEAFALHVDDFNVTKDGNVEIKIYKTIVEDETGCELKFRTKTLGSKRVVFIPTVVYKMVMDYYNDCINNESANDKYLRSMNGTEGYIFVNKDKEFINKRAFERNFRDYLKRRGISKVCLHMYRHSYASLQAEKLPFDKVAMMLGDSPETVYKNYYSLSQKSKKDISDNVNTIYNQFEF